jgi:probable HAF family extracellular repeat protein
MAAAQVTTYTFASFDVPGAASTYATGINNGGQIVGPFWDNVGSHGFLLDIDGSFTAIDAPGSRGTYPSSINDAGQIVGEFDDSSLVSHGFVYSDGSLTPFDVPGATGTYARGINNVRSLATSLTAQDRMASSTAAGASPRSMCRYPRPCFWASTTPVRSLAPSMTAAWSRTASSVT